MSQPIKEEPEPESFPITKNKDAASAYIKDGYAKTCWARIKITLCLFLLFMSVLVYLGGVISMKLFAGWLVLGFFLCTGLVAVVIAAINCIVCFVFLVQKTRYTKTCVFILLCSLVFIIYLIHSYKILEDISSMRRNQTYSTIPRSDIEITNTVRKQLGIREIKPDWQFYIHQFNTDKWKDRDYPCKTVQMTEDPNELLWEADEYYTGTKWTTVNGVVAWEHVVVTYDYTFKLFSIGYSGPNKKMNALVGNLKLTSYGFAANANEETLKIADEILSYLGLSRL